MSIHKYDASNDKLTRLAGGTLWADSPIGTILAYGGATPPSGWMLAQGQAISRTTYSELFAVIGTAFGSGDGSTTFNIPDMREATTKGVGENPNGASHVKSGGLALGEFIDDRIQEHTHSAPNGANFFITGNVASMASGTGLPYGGSSITTSNSGRSGNTTEVKAVGVNYIIKAKMVGVPADFMDAVNEAVGYSTSEQLTGGKWIDGKPIYRKVFVINDTAPSTIQTGLNSTDYVISMQSKAKYKGDSIYYSFMGGEGTSGNALSSIYLLTDDNTQMALISGGYTGYVDFIILEYTKAD